MLEIEAFKVLSGCFEAAKNGILNSTSEFNFQQAPATMKQTLFMRTQKYYSSNKSTKHYGVNLGNNIFNMISSIPEDNRISVLDSALDFEYFLVYPYFCCQSGFQNNG